MQAELLRRPGWSLPICKRLLGRPDVIRVSTSIRNYYNLERVEAIEKSESFQKTQRRSAKLKSVARQANCTKINKLLNKISNVYVRVFRISNIESIALSNFYEKKAYAVQWNTDDINFKHRVIVNYIRHNLTWYDVELRAIKGKTGRQLASNLLKQRVYWRIAKMYPEYKDECDKQLSVRTNGKLYLQVEGPRIEGLKALACILQKSGIFFDFVNHSYGVDVPYTLRPNNDVLANVVKFYGTLRAYKNENKVFVQQGPNHFEVTLSKNLEIRLIPGYYGTKL